MRSAAQYAQCMIGVSQPRAWIPLGPVVRDPTRVFAMRAFQPPTKRSVVHDWRLVLGRVRSCQLYHLRSLSELAGARPDSYRPTIGHVAKPHEPHLVDPPID